MVAATVDPKLTDSDISDALIMYALADSNGLAPDSDNPAWVEGYDYLGAAIEALGWKKAAATAMVNFNADGSQASMSDITEHLDKLIAQYAAQRSLGTFSVYAE
jgi:hypothetical protein